MITVTKCS